MRLFVRKPPYFDIVIAGPVCATVDTLIWNNW